MNDYSRQKSVSGISYKSLFELLCLCLLFDLKIAKIIYIFERKECSFIVIISVFDVRKIPITLTISAKLILSFFWE